MNHFWEVIASNALVATGLALGVALLSRVWKNTAAIHLLWVIVLFKFFTPPIVTAQLPFAANWLSSATHTELLDRPAVSLAFESSKQAATRLAANTDDSAETNSAVNRERYISPVLGDGKPWSLTAILATIWILGSVCIATSYTIRVRRFARLLQDVDQPSRDISTTVDRLAGQLGLRRVPSVVMTPSVVPPLVWCVGLRPRLILPARLFDRLSETSQAAILAHELTHVRRGDYLVRFLELAATTLFWWHPVVWWACAQLHDLEEQCCDRRALELVPDEARTYAAALVETLEFLSEQPRVLVPLPTAIYSAGSLSRRIRMLAQNRVSQLHVGSAVLVAMIAALPLVVAFAGETSKAEQGAGKEAANVGDSMAAAVLSGRVTNKAGEPLAGARVRVAIPGTDMRFLDERPKLKKLEAIADGDGNYRLEITGITKPTKISIDAMKPGYRKLAGTLMSGGDQKNIEVAPGAKAQASLTLMPSLYVKGVVVDKQGKPVAGVEVAANANWKKASGGIERTVTNADGSFELFNYPTEVPNDKDGKAKGTVGFLHPSYLMGEIDNIYAHSEGERERQRIVLHSGTKIAGTVVDTDGKPVAGVMVVVGSHDGFSRKAQLTDANGNFNLQGLKAGKTNLRAHALNLKQKLELPIDLIADMSNLEVRLKPVRLSAEPKSFDVLGMQLTDNSPELQGVYDLYDPCGALILNPGKDSKRFKIGELAEGYTFWMAGDERVNNVREFIRGILAEVDKQTGDTYSVRVVYNFDRPEMAGSNTQYMKLTKSDVEQLKSVLSEVTEK